MRCLQLLTLLMVVTLLPVAAYADPITLSAILSGANENPVVPSPGTGMAVVVLDPTAHTIQINVTFSNLTSNTVAAHIHCCIAPPGNTGVATTVPAFPGFPLGGTSGNYSSVVFDLTQPQIYNPAFVTAQGGLPQAQTALVNGLLAGQTYLNIHTVNFGGGEIRGALTPAVVPEPTSVFVLGSGLLGLVVMRRKLGAHRV
jgi:CHRD domain/PEP-CTERM motif